MSTKPNEDLTADLYTMVNGKKVRNKKKVNIDDTAVSSNEDNSDGEKLEVTNRILTKVRVEYICSTNSTLNVHDEVHALLTKFKQIDPTVAVV